MTETNRPTLTTAASMRSARVVEAALSDVADQGERIFALARIAICASIAVVWPFAVWPDLKAGAVTAWMVEGVVFSTFLLGLLLWVVVRHRGGTTRALSLGSILLDTAMALALSLGVVLAPPPDFIGAFHVTGQPIVYLAIAAAGLRLSRTNALVAGGVALAGLVVVYVVDHQVNAERTLDGPVHLTSLPF